MVAVLVGSIKHFKVPAPLVGQGIRSAFTGDERGEGHETRHDSLENLQFLLQSREEANAHLLVR
jgi:hypothetical protein